MPANSMEDDQSETTPARDPGRARQQTGQLASRHTEDRMPSGRNPSAERLRAELPRAELPCAEIAFDAVLVLSFGGPEQPGEVMPFLEGILKGRNFPRERLLEVAGHYYHFGGKSPINAQNRALITKLTVELEKNGPKLPIYWGNRNWHPLMADTLRQMRDDGVRRALAFVTSAFSSYSGCRQYLDDIVRAREQAGPRAPVIEKLRVFYNHPGFIEPMIEHVQEALARFPEAARDEVPLVFTAHSVPSSMAKNSHYVEQLEEARRLIAAGAGRQDAVLVYQSRSGPRSQPWLEPDIRDYLRDLRSRSRAPGVVVVPVGFISDHMEVLFDLDTQARQVCDEIGLRMVRARTVGTHPKFIRMIRELLLERIENRSERRSLGDLGSRPDVCPADCCPAPQRPTAGGAGGVRGSLASG